MMEPEVIDYIAEKGRKNEWDIAVLELGINVLVDEWVLARDDVAYV